MSQRSSTRDQFHSSGGSIASRLSRRHTVSRHHGVFQRFVESTLDLHPQMIDCLRAVNREVEGEIHMNEHDMMDLFIDVVRGICGFQVATQVAVAWQQHDN